MNFRPGQDVAWPIPTAAGQRYREGKIVFVRQEGSTDEDLDTAMRGAGWTGAVRVLRWRRHPGQVPEVVVVSERDGRPTFYAPLVEDLVVDADFGAAPPVAAAGTAAEIQAAFVATMTPPADLGTGGFRTREPPDDLGDLPPLPRRPWPAGGGFATRSLPGNSATIKARLRALVVRPRAAAAESLSALVAPEAALPLEPAAEALSPAEAPLPFSLREATKEAVARELLRFLDGTPRTRDDLYAQIRPLFTESDHRLRGVFARSLERCMSERRVIRSWVETGAGPILGYLAVARH